MFEDSTFESAHRIKSKSGRWMLVTGSINCAVLVVAILLPLIYPEALPSALMATVLTLPPPPPPPPPPPEVHVVHVQSEMMNNQLTAPTKIPHNIQMVSEKEAPPSSFGVAGMDGMGGGNGAMGSMFGSGNAPKVQVAAPKKINVSAGVATGNLIQKVQPVYPPIAKAARVQGTVVLQATISKTGTIENLKVVSGPAMLQQAAKDAVQQWRYRPWLLNNEAVEVDTTVNVVFTLGG
jgi:periplasmic protein TonB